MLYRLPFTTLYSTLPEKFCCSPLAGVTVAWSAISITGVSEVTSDLGGSITLTVMFSLSIVPCVPFIVNSWIVTSCERSRDSRLSSSQAVKSRQHADNIIAIKLKYFFISCLFKIISIRNFVYIHPYCNLFAVEVWAHIHFCSL